MFYKTYKCGISLFLACGLVTTGLWAGHSHSCEGGGFIDVEPQIMTIEKTSEFDMSLKRLPDPMHGNSHKLTHPAATLPNPFKMAGCPKSNPKLKLSRESLNAYDSRFASNQTNRGTSPPDQGLCAGNGYVIAGVNQAIAVYDNKGNLLTEPVANNDFFGLPPTINPVTQLIEGPDNFDVVSLYDKGSDRFFILVTGMDRFAGNTNTIKGDLAPHFSAYWLGVSQTGNPLGKWNIYKIPNDNNGQNGTPFIPCGEFPCFADFPKIGADEHGFYISGGIFDWETQSGPFAATIHALPKKALQKGDCSMRALVYDSRDIALEPSGEPYFVCWPAICPGKKYDRSMGGTMYFTATVDNSLFAGAPPTDILRVISFSNTKSIDCETPKIKVSVASFHSDFLFEFPSLASQPNGNKPIKECLNDRTGNVVEDKSVEFCWEYYEEEPFLAEDIPVDTLVTENGSSPRFADGKLWFAAVNPVDVDGERLAGFNYFILKPRMTDCGLALKILKQGSVGVKNNYLIAPALAITDDGVGVVTYSIVGPDHYLSHAYSPIDAKVGVGDIHIVSRGVGPLEDIFGYQSGDIFRTGDYSWTAVDGNEIWIASNTVEQTCTLDEFLSEVPTAANSLRRSTDSSVFAGMYLPGDQYATCGNTRHGTANFSTRMSKLVVKKNNHHKDD